MEIGTALSQADSNFLQRELEEKEADIGVSRLKIFLKRRGVGFNHFTAAVLCLR